MGRESESSNGRGKGRNRKSKGRMSYLSRVRKGGGGGRGGAQEGKVDEYGQKYGDYVPAYGSKPSWKNSGGGRGYKQKEVLRPGMIGFLCSTNNMRENECAREAYNILNEYCDKTGDSDDKKEVTAETSEPIKSIEKPEMDASASSNVRVRFETVYRNTYYFHASLNSCCIARMSIYDPNCNYVGFKVDLEANCANPLPAEMPSGSETPANDDDEEDIDDALASELKNLKSEKTIRKFQRVDTGVKNILFISTTVRLNNFLKSF